MIWRLGIWSHEHIEATWLWMIWWKLGSRWVYRFMQKSKDKGKLWAQPFGEGLEGAQRYIDDSFIQTLRLS